MIHPEIKDNEFRAMARERGYELRKHKEPTYILPCPVCDTKRTSIWFAIGKETSSMSLLRRCKHCGFEGYLAKSKELSKVSWNEAVKDCLKSKGQNLVDGGNDNVEYRAR